MSQAVFYKCVPKGASKQITVCLTGDEGSYFEKYIDAYKVAIPSEISPRVHPDYIRQNMQYNSTTVICINTSNNLRYNI